MIIKSFLQSKNEFDNNYGKSLVLERSIVPVDGKYIKNISIANHQGDRKDKDQEALDWLREHLIFVIEFKKENSKDTETVFNVQLKPALNESEADFCIGVIYDTERLYLFQKKNGKVLRLDASYNQKAEKSSTRDLSLRITDSYYKIPS